MDVLIKSETVLMQSEGSDGSDTPCVCLGGMRMWISRRQVGGSGCQSDDSAARWMDQEARQMSQAH